MGKDIVPKNKPKTRLILASWAPGCRWLPRRLVAAGKVGPGFNRERKRNMAELYGRVRGYDRAGRLLAKENTRIGHTKMEVSAETQDPKMGGKLSLILKPGGDFIVTIEDKGVAAGGEGSRTLIRGNVEKGDRWAAARLHPYDLTIMGEEAPEIE